MLSALNIRWRDGLSPEAANAACHPRNGIGFRWGLASSLPLSYSRYDMQPYKAQPGSI